MASASILDASDMPPLIQLDKVGQNFGPNLVLDGVDFDLCPGEVHALCGKNCVGKSTCLGLLYGLHHPTQQEQATRRPATESDIVDYYKKTESKHIQIGIVVTVLILV